LSLGENFPAADFFLFIDAFFETATTDSDIPLQV